MSLLADGPHRALIVEDDRSWQLILTEMLRDAGLLVDVTDSYATATTTIRAASHRLAVVDLSLGGVDHHNQDGLRILDALRKHDPDCASVLLTGFATVEIAVSAMKDYGAYTSLRKERFRRSQFRTLVQEILADAKSTTAEPVGDVNGSEGSGATGGSEGAQVVVVEDDAGWQEILVELLSDGGHRTQLCRSYGEAIGVFKRQSFDLAVVDLSLASSAKSDGNADGLRVLAACRDAGVPTIVVSGMASPQDAERIYQEFGAFAFLEKQSFSRMAFNQTVHDTLNVETIVSPLDVLTTRERDVFELLAQGMTNKAIAEQLVISPNTVKRHLKAIFVKLDVNTRSAAVSIGAGNRV